MPALSLSEFQHRIEGLNELPSLPAILFPVLNQLNGNVDDIDIRKTVQLVSHDGALSTQVIHMANSPLFGMRNRVSTLRAAALTLGVSRLRDIVTSCCLMQLSPKGSDMDVASFWEHSLACALISRNLARKLGYPDPERAYLAGLLHDLGILVNMLLIPKEFTRTFKIAAESGRPLRDVELDEIGISHEVTGVLLSTHWQLFDYLAEVMRRHHDVENATLDPTLASIVNIADLLCRTSGLGYGYQENLTVTLQDEVAWKIISNQSPRLQSFDMVRFTLEVESYVKEVRTLVSVLFRL
jgi:putative nucleotidyltransferase with HDIG domain